MSSGSTYVAHKLHFLLQFSLTKVISGCILGISLRQQTETGERGDTGIMSSARMAVCFKPLCDIIGQTLHTDMLSILSLFVCLYAVFV